MTKYRESAAAALDGVLQDGMTIAAGGFGVCGIPSGLIEVVRNSGGEQALCKQYLDGLLEVEFVPQGTLAERLRAGGAGIPAFFTKTGVGTPLAEGRPHETFDGETYLLERAIVADVALVRAHSVDPQGNLRYRWTARNFNPLVATAGRTTIAEVENLETEFLDPDTVMRQ